MVTPSPTAPVHVLTICGSLQARSANLALLRAVAHVAPPGMIFTPFDGIRTLPQFDVDLDVEPADPSVAAWRSALSGCDGILIATPEYAFGMPGALKNALDWVVGSAELVHKPAAIISASPLATGGAIALEQIERTVRVMSAVVVATLAVPFVKTLLDEAGMIDDPGTLEALAGMARSLEAAVAPREASA